jgi:hypothetical protein
MEKAFRYDLVTFEWMPGEEIFVSPDEDGKYNFPAGYTLKAVPMPNYKIVYDPKKDEWIETITDEELAALHVPGPKTEFDKLKDEMAAEMAAQSAEYQQKNDQLKVKLEAAQRDNAQMNLAIIELWENLI